MPLWPFGRNKARSSTPQPTSSDVEKSTNDRNHFANYPQNATPRIAAQTKSPEDTPRKRRRSSPGLYDEKETGDGAEDYEKPRIPRSRASREDITALPGSRKLETSPHLRSPASPAIPYNSSSKPDSRAAVTDRPMSPTTKSRRDKKVSRAPSSSQKRRLSKRQEHVERAIREEEIRAMSAPVAIPKRTGGNGDMLRRDSKKAKRTFSKNAGDARGSNVSLPFQESIHSSMSGTSGQRGWEVTGLDFLNPRPRVRLSLPMGQTASFTDPSGVSNGSKKDKLPALKEDIKAKDRRRIADLADGLDASDIRALMERDSRRKDKKKLAEQIKLERSLQKRAEKQRIEDEQRARDLGTPAPNSIHPAFRTKTEEKQPVSDSTIGQAPPTPTSVKQEKTVNQPLQYGGTYLKYEPMENPFRDPEPSPFADPETRQAVPGAQSYSPMGTPMETPMEDPILETAHAVRFSQGRLSMTSPSPPLSPILGVQQGRMSPLRREYTPETTVLPSPVEERHFSESAPKRPSTWAQLFKRGTLSRSTTEDPVVSPSETSFSNTSRESRSRQPIPAHLVGTMGSVSNRRSATPVRTQSIFREDLPETSDPRLTTKVASPVLGMSASAVAARRANRNTMPESDLTGLGRTDSPVETDGRSSAMALSSSLASIDSEGEWLTGRPSLKKSNASQVRSSIGSLARKREEFSASYEDLGMPEDEYFRRLTPNPDTGAGFSASDHDDTDTMIRRDTNRRRPTLVQRDPRVKSREGLLLDYAGGESAALVEEESHSGQPSPDNDKFDDQHGQTVEYGRHARKISSGSAKLLDIPPSRNRSGRTSPENRLSGAGTPTASPRL